MFGQLGFSEIMIIVLILVVLFGPSKIPQLGKGLGEGIRNFKSAIKAIGEDVEEKPRAEKQ